MNDMQNAMGAHSFLSSESIFGTGASLMSRGPPADWILCSAFINAHKLSKIIQTLLNNKIIRAEDSAVIIRRSLNLLIQKGAKFIQKVIIICVARAHQLQTKNKFQGYQLIQEFHPATKIMRLLWKSDLQRMVSSIVGQSNLKRGEC